MSAKGAIASGFIGNWQLATDNRQLIPVDFGFKILPKESFFDGPLVMGIASRAQRAIGSKVGAFLWTRMKSITSHQSRKSAAPGQPPKRHAGQLHDLIYFAWDAIAENVLIGPLVFKEGEAPRLLEFGGVARRRRVNFRKAQGVITRVLGAEYQAHYAGNPFALPSLEAEVEAGTIPEAWAGAVRSGG